MSASSTSTSSQWDIDVPDNVVHQAVENVGNFPFERREVGNGGKGGSRGLGTVGDRRQADQQCFVLWNFHWTKHQHNYCKVNSVLDSSLVILDLHSTLSFLKVKLQTELITLWLSCGFCRLGYVVARPGTRYGGGGGGGGRYAKLGVHGISRILPFVLERYRTSYLPRTRKIPYLISSSYSGNVLYIYIYIYI